MNRLVALASLLLAGAAQAHHSFAMFDYQKDVTLAGEVKQFQWTNPHTWIQLLVADGKGGQTEWSIEGSSPNALSRRGWKRNSLAPGEKVTVVIHPLRDGSSGGSVVRVTRANGEVVGDPAVPPSGTGAAITGSAR